MSTGTIRYWLRWKEKGADPRPLKVPPPPQVKGWWCTGCGDDSSTVCAVVDVNGTEDSAWEALDGFWSPMAGTKSADSKGWAKDGWMPDPGRFPVKPKGAKP